MNESNSYLQNFNNVAQEMAEAKPQHTEPTTPVTINIGDELLFKGIPFKVAMINKTNLVIRPLVGQFRNPDVQPAKKIHKRH